VLFAVIFAIGFLTSGSTPDTDAPGEEVIAHYSDQNKIFALTIALALAAVLFLFFAGVLRQSLGSSSRAPEWLATVAFGGGIVYAVSLAIFAMGQVMLIDAADLGRPEVAQALNIFDNDNFFPAVIGLATILLATGWHTLRSSVLPPWLGWVSLVLGVLAFAGPLGFLAFLLFPVWVAVVSILLYRRTTAAADALDAMEA
jgi:MFS family permease